MIGSVDNPGASACTVGPGRAGKRAAPAVRMIWCVAFAVALIVYAGTANRGPQSQDSGWQQLRIVTGQLEHPYGFPLYHPLQYYLGRAAISLSRLEPAFAITLVSSTAAAVAVANLAAAMALLTRRRDVALIAACAFMLSHTFWMHATYTESYALVAALLSGEWLCLALYVRSGRGHFLALLLFLNGLGISTHLLAVLATPVDAAVLWQAVRRRRLPRGTLLLGLAFWFVGASLYVLPVIREAVRTGDVLATLHTALFSNYRSEVLNVRLSSGMLLLTAGFFIYNFPGLTLPLAGVGLIGRKTVPRTVKRVLTVQLILYAGFALRYSVPDQYTFYFPIYMVLTVLSGAGLARLRRGEKRTWRKAILAAAAVTAAWTPLVYVTAAKLVSRSGAFAAMVKNKPYRDGYRTFFIPWGRGANELTRVNETAQALAGADGIIAVRDRMQLFGVRYAQAVGYLPETVTILDIAGKSAEQVSTERRALLEECLATGRPVVLVPVDRDRPDSGIAGTCWERVGDLYRLSGLVDADDEQGSP